MTETGLAIALVLIVVVIFLPLMFGSFDPNDPKIPPDDFNPDDLD